MEVITCAGKIQKGNVDEVVNEQTC